MQKKSFPKKLLIFILVILLLQVIASYFYWYWRIWWFDMLMHFAGGLWVGLSILWLYFLSGRIVMFPQNKTISPIVVGVVAVLCVAILWEVFEYLVQVLFPQGTPYDILDTLSDIFFGFLGGTAASFVFLKKRYM